MKNKLNISFKYHVIINNHYQSIDNLLIIYI